MMFLSCLIYGVLFCLLAPNTSAFEEEPIPRVICGIEKEQSMFIYHCFDTIEGVQFIRRIDVKVEKKDTTNAKLLEDGVKIVKFDKMLEIIAAKLVEQLGYTDENTLGWWQLFFYRPGQFNSLGPNDPTIERLKKLATILHSVGVCQLPVIKANYRNINIRTIDDVLLHFLCIANSESVFGLRNIGVGGRGPWGIGPQHTTTRGACYLQAPQAILRNASGREILDSTRYFTDQEVLKDNARCAFVLYRKTGFASWGTNSDNWGSNRHCTANVRAKMNFAKFLGAQASCLSRKN